MMARLATVTADAPRRTGGFAVSWALIAAGGVLAAALVFLVAGYLLGESLPLLLRGGGARFFSDDGWWPQEGSFNLLPMVCASLLLTLGALLLATPLSLVFAVYTVFYAPPAVGTLLRRLVDVSAAVPTVIYGLWGLASVVPLLAAVAAPGASLLAGMLVMAVMIFPTLTVLAQSALQAVPVAYAQAAQALGVGRGATLWRVVLPAARHGIAAAMALGAARAIGETMVVLMVCGNVVQMPDSLWAPVRTLTANIALEMPYAMGEHRTALFVAGLMVLLLVALLVAASETVAQRVRRSGA